MKNIITVSMIALFLASCSQDNEVIDASENLTSPLALELNSNIGTYQAVITTIDSEVRASIEINIPDGSNAQLLNVAYPTATVTFENNKQVVLTSDILQYPNSDTEIIFSNDQLNFQFSVDALGNNESINNISFEKKAAEAIVLKSTFRAPVTPLTGTYVCTDCGTHPNLDSGVVQSFNNLVITPVDGSPATIMTQVMLGGSSFNGTGSQSNCIADGNLTSCDISGTVAAPSMPVNFSGIHIFNNENTAAGNDCSQVNGTWTWQTINYGLLSGDFESEPTCVPPVSFTLLDYNFDGYTGAGFSPTPGAGQLDSNVIIANGLSGGTLAYGGTTPTSGDDYARGTSSGGTATGGLYNFEVAPGNATFGIQPGGSDFTPGDVDVRVLNNTGSTLTSFDISYLVFANNDRERGNSLNFSYSTDNVTFTNVTALDYTSTEVSDALGFVSNTRMTTISATVADAGFLYIRFTGNDETGGGSRDEFAIDDILVIGNE